jgi:hypothetical protein
MKEVNAIAKQVLRKGYYRMSFAIDPKLHDQFKEATNAQYEKMSQVIVRFIKQYVDDYHAKQATSGQKKRGRK